jgi:hypothetical protein
VSRRQRGHRIADLRKEYRVRIWVKLTDDLLPSPQLTKEELRSLLEGALRVGQPDSPVVSVAVEDPRR